MPGVQNMFVTNCFMEVWLLLGVEGDKIMYKMDQYKPSAIELTLPCSCYEH